MTTRRGDEEVKRIDASLGAIIEAAYAFGLTWILFTPGACTMSRSENELGWPREGATPEEAAARALVAAWGDGKPPSSTEPRKGES